MESSNQTGTQTIWEKETPLSQSRLWNLLDEGYQTLGPNAWVDWQTPLYPTNNPSLAQHYAQIIIGFLRDLKGSGELNESEPFYIIDWGAGSGRFAYLFLQHFLPLLKASPLHHIKVRYLLTDPMFENLLFWQSHEALRQEVLSGQVDFCLLKENSGKELSLVHAEKTISTDDIINPIAYITGYLFNSVKHDLFGVKEHQLQEGRVTLSREQDDVAEKDPAFISGLHPSWSYTPIEKPTEYYGQGTVLNTILHDYAKKIKTGHFLFPIGAFNVIAKMSSLSKNRFLLLSADQGRATLDQVNDWGDIQLSKHGGFSMDVNYHAIGEYFRRQSGKSWASTNPKFLSSISACGLEADLRETQLAFKQMTDGFTVLDGIDLLNELRPIAHTLSFKHLVLMIKCLHYDPTVFCDVYDAFAGKIDDLSPPEKAELTTVLQNVQRNYYPIGGEDTQLYLMIANMYVYMGMEDEAADSLASMYAYRRT